MMEISQVVQINYNRNWEDDIFNDVIYSKIKLIEKQHVNSNL